MTPLANGVLLIDPVYPRCVMSDMAEVGDCWVFNCNPNWLYGEAYRSLHELRIMHTTIHQRAGYYDHHSTVVVEKSKVTLNEETLRYINRRKRK